MMKFNCVRIQYGKLIMVCDTIVKGTILPFNDPWIKYSYLAKGKVEPLYNCNSIQDMMFNEGDLNPVGKIVNLDQVRYMAVHESGELCCFLSTKSDPILTLHTSTDSLQLEPNTPAIVMDGEFEVEGKIAKRFVMVRERDHEVTLNGIGKIIKVRY